MLERGLTLKTEHAPKQDTNKIKSSRGHRLLGVVVFVVVLKLQLFVSLLGTARPLLVCESARLKKYKRELQLSSRPQRKCNNTVLMTVFVVRCCFSTTQKRKQHTPVVACEFLLQLCCLFVRLWIWLGCV